MEAGLITAMRTRLLVFGEAIASTVSGWLKIAIGTVVGSAAFKVIVEGSLTSYIVKEVREKTGLELDPDEPLTKQSFVHAISVKFDMPLDPVQPFSPRSIAYGFGQKTGLMLDPDNPFSAQSVTGAIMSKVGFDITIRDITNRQMLLEDIQAPIVVKLNQQLGTSFAKLFPVDGDLISNFQQQIYNQFEKAMIGQPTPFFPINRIELIKERLEQKYGSLLPITLSDTAKAISARDYSRKYYDRNRRDGYIRKWVKVPVTPPTTPTTP